MQSKIPPSAGGEPVMWNAQLQVLVSKRADLAEVGWTLDLCSPFWRIYVHDRAGAFAEFDGERLAFRKGTLWIIPAWVRFQTGLERPVLQDYIHFNFAGLPSPQLQRFFARPLALSQDEPLSALAAKWRNGLTAPADFSHLCWAAALAHAVMAKVLSDWSKEELGGYLRWLAESADVQAALERIETNLAKAPSNLELSRLCGAGEDHFIRKFRKITGLTPAQYGRDCRIALVAKWLISTDRTLEDIADSSGFADRFHLSRVFKERFGLPPAAYRRMHRREGN